MTGEPVKVDSIVGVWSFLASIDWEEQWLWWLIGFHVICFILSLLSLGRQTLQICLFLIFLLSIYCSEYINEWAAKNYKLFSKQQYFDSNGLFISLLFSTPLLINCIIIVVSWMWLSMSMLVTVKRAKLRQDALSKQQKKEE